jgi:hypothetical protein
MPRRWARKTITGYRDTPGFPEPGGDGRSRYDDLASVVEFPRSRPTPDPHAGSVLTARISGPRSGD